MSICSFSHADQTKIFPFESAMILGLVCGECVTCSHCFLSTKHDHTLTQKPELITLMKKRIIENLYTSL